jgi:hypothetical protein
MEMSIRRSKGGKTCLVLGGHAIINFITHGKSGLVKTMMPTDKFLKEWNKVLDVSLLDGLTSYICVAKRAHKHDANIIAILWELFMNQYSNEMSLAQLVLCYNKLAASVGKPARKSFDSKAAALAAIEKLDIILSQQTPQQDAAQTRRNTMSEKDVAEKKPRGKGIGARAKELILEGKTTAEVISTIQEEIEGANPTPATIAWYKNKLRQEGLLAPSNRKAKAEVAETEGEDEAA